MMKLTVPLVFFFAVLSVSGCSPSAKVACTEWIDAKEIYASYDQCLACAKAYGTKDIHSVRACTFKRELESLR